jgi:hypothetical protein
MGNNRTNNNDYYVLANAHGFAYCKHSRHNEVRFTDDLAAARVFPNYLKAKYYLEAKQKTNDAFRHMIVVHQSVSRLRKK